MPVALLLAVVVATTMCSAADSVTALPSTGTTTSPFMFDVNPGGDQLVVKFVDLLHWKNVSSHKWSFGDGATDTARNPRHVYAKPGTYTVKMSLTTPDGVKDFEMNDVVVGGSAGRSAGTRTATQSPGFGGVLAFVAVGLCLTALRASRRR